MMESVSLAAVDRPVIEWTPVDVQLPPRGRKVHGLSFCGTLILGDLHELAKGDKPFIVCWRETPKKPKNWKELLKRLGH